MLTLRDISRKIHGLPGVVKNPSWAYDYALSLLDAEGRVAAWYSGAERIYGYQEREITGRSLSCLAEAEQRYFAVK